MSKLEFFILGLATGFLFFLFILFIENDGTDGFLYKRGQINALTGIVEYELIIHPGSTKTWEFIEK